ncbi:2-hydroxyacid dehydrogenase [Mycolicibacterium grossiae]|uniref:Hydroxyacid dehydrogenase n=1 Tax=Mycolicibacterium grossiae TaxID=1552759 RepID=A0A1E8Q5R4_9MYCO|nr:2-hydroxyacid dehydrogenase [Mycolicibacterium grossiae]OFJ53786.1 hydroxyacid dehydrogenase [Mycolicibacterium grossiae]QEM43934.1 hydroxyacid dehydrogenase [Mycolicibacterium grossiae]
MRIVVADANLAPHRDRFTAALPDGADVAWCAGAPDAVAAALPSADVFVGGRFTADMAETAGRLRLVHVFGAGTDRIDFDALPDGVLVANAFGHERSIAEYVLAAAIVLRRDVLDQDRALRRGVWATSVYDGAIAQLHALRDGRVGLVGFGHIGARVWEAFRAFGCTGAAVTGSGRLDAAEHGLAWAADVSRLDDLMADSDVVVVSAPLTPATTGLIGARQLAALGGDGVLINVGRGPLVDERALYDALAGRVVKAAAIDVWYRYPAARGEPATPSDLPFAELTNVLMTPHSSGITTDTFRRRADDVAANIGRLARGERLHDLVRG